MQALTHLNAGRKSSMQREIQAMRKAVSEYNSVRYPYSHFNRTFDSFLAVLLLFTMLVSPFELAFLEFGYDALFAINRIVDLGFMMDIYVNFTTAVQRSDDTWIKSPKKVALRYLRGTFVLDLVSTIP